MGVVTGCREAVVISKRSLFDYNWPQTPSGLIINDV